MSTRRRRIAGTALTLAILLVSPAVAQESAADFWDRVFRERAFRAVGDDDFIAYCTERLLRERKLQRGNQVLVLAMGDGRNAVHLAQQGLAVTGLDISEVALKKARAAAAERGLEITALSADLFEHDLGTERWDLVTNVYFNPAIRVFERIKRAVRPGGFLLVEGFGSEHRSGPPEWSRYRPGELLEKLKGWRILEYQDGLFPSHWAGKGDFPVVRVLAQKPAD